jgi:hypothetical protein
MNTLIQARESSMSRTKRIAVAIAILAVCGLALWIGLQMALRMTSGHS